MLGFGDFLLLMAERLEQGGASREDVLDCLKQINEAWDRQLDPAAEFEAYAALRLCQSIQRILENPSGQVTD
jgi:hypothetical protein